MKAIINITRIIVGVLFIFSGLVKANDPLGLSYKMQEFFEAWNWDGLQDFTLPVSVIMNVFEVVAGVAIIIGWRMKLFSWLLLLLIIFFSFLTGYAMFSGKIKTCGCFGDCLPLSPAQSFTKDIILLVLILFIFARRSKISSSIKRISAIGLLSVCTAAVVFIQFYVLKHLPFVDCLPYKAGNNLLLQMQPPPGAVPDSTILIFKYKKDGKDFEFTEETLPEDIDSYQFVDRIDKVIRKGNDTPPISDLAFFSESGADTTMDILSRPGYYVLLIAKDFSTEHNWNNISLGGLKQILTQKEIPLFIVTSDKQKGKEYVAANDNTTLLLCDATVLKTAARVNATYFVMHGADIKAKFSFEDLGNNLEKIKSLQ